MRKIVLPNRSGTGISETIEFTDSLVILGSNGSGKSRLGLLIEVNTPNGFAKRISAQRLLNLPEFAPVMSHEQSLNQYLNSFKNRQVIEVQDDYLSVLATVFSKTVKRDSDYINLCKQNLGNNTPEIPESVTEKLIRIWNDVLPHRKINLVDSKIIATSPDGEEYFGKHMSDGERVALYLIAQCLVVPDNYTIIIDEPELHLHKALMSNLWNKIESERNDCTFIYITHDLDFAASRVKAKKLWVKSYSGGIWTWEIVPDSNQIPESLLLEIIGSRKPILFVEGERGSYDHVIYQFYYPNYTIIPRGSGLKVIESTKGISTNSGLHHIKAYGLVDRDYKLTGEISKLEQHNIFTIGVAEIENLLLVPTIIRIVSEHLALDKDDILIRVTNYIIDLFIKDFEKEVSYATSLEINYKLNTLDTKRSGTSEIKKAIDDLVKSIDVETTYKKYEDLYNEIILKKNIELALRYYNNKGLLPNISKFFGLTGGGYSELVIRLLKTDKGEKILDSLKAYLPDEKRFI